MNKAIIIASLALSSWLSADVIITKKGKTYDGIITEETESSVSIKYFITKGVRELKKIPRSEISKMTKIGKDVKAFKSLKVLENTADLQKPSWYDSKIKYVIKPFLRKYPKSKHFSEAHLILAKLENEKRIITEGGLKVDGTLFNKVEVDKNYYDIKAGIMLKDIQKFAKWGRANQALRKYEQLQKLYPLSTHTHTAHKEVAKLAKRYRLKLIALEKSHSKLISSTKKRLESLTERDKSKLQKELERNDARHQRQYRYEKDILKTSWCHVSPRDLTSITEALEKIKEVEHSTSVQKLAKDPNGGAYYFGANLQIDNGLIDSANILIDHLDSLGFPQAKVKELRVKSKARNRQVVRERKLAKLKKASVHATMKDVLEQEQRRNEASVFDTNTEPQK